MTQGGEPSGSKVGGVAVAAYGFAVYGIFVLVMAYLVGFVANAVVAKSIDHGGGDGALTIAAVIIDVLLLALFGAQHSVMARQAFKQSWTRVIPTSAERSTYVLAASTCLIVLYVAWRPITTEIWGVSAQPWRVLLWVISGLGWLMVLVSSYLIDHFELFGLRQVIARLKNMRTPEHKFATPFLYRFVRHPLYTGFLIAFWVTPTMTLGHLIFAVVMTGYVLLAVQFEERDLIAMFGDGYRDYRRRVSMLIPGLGGHS